jgi:hypothetical protein
MVHWLISVPVPPNQAREAVTARISKRLTGDSIQFHLFDIPALRKGSQDSLYSLMDDLAKYDQSIEGAVHRALKSLRDVTEVEKEEDFIPEVILEDINGPPQKSNSTKIHPFRTGKGLPSHFQMG